MAQDLEENLSLGQDSVPSTVREVQVDGNTLSSDGKGKIMYDGADGSGFWIAPDGSTSSWKAGEIPITNLPGMEELSNFGSIANSPEAEEAFGKQGMIQGKGSQFGQLHDFFLKHA